MRTTLKLTLSIVSILFSSTVIQAQDARIQASDKQFRYLLQLVEAQVDGQHVAPRTIEKEKLHLVPSRDWTSGFYAGTLWYLYKFTGHQEWKDAAEQATQRIEAEKFNGNTHDMGFKIYCSFGNGYAFTKNPAYEKVIITAAKTLATRFNPKVGSIRSWDHNTDKWQFPVIMDNMLNLELLFAATKLTKDSAYYNIAVAHADKTLANHFREDGGSYHVVDYDPATGDVKHKHTHQGYAHQSTWARGQAWALYGFTMCYRETGDTRYLQKALAIAEWIKNHHNLPKDGVAYWDFDAPNIPDEPRDASAAAVMASALYELSRLNDNNKELSNFANKIFDSLTQYYTNAVGTNGGFLLQHSTGSKPHHSEVDVPLIYADYYYLEALGRKLNII